MSISDLPRNSFGGMDKTTPSSFPSSNYSSFGHAGPSYLTPQDIQQQNPPPAYEDIFRQTQIPDITTSGFSRRPVKQGDYYNKDDRNMWEKLDDWFELSVLQHIIWLAVLAFSISYIVFGLKYQGECSKKSFNNKGNKTSEDSEDLTSFIQAEGGVLCATVLFISFLRILEMCDVRSTQRKSKSDLEEQKKWGGLLFFLCLGLYIVNFALCNAGASKIFSLYHDETNTTVKCDQDFYDFYHSAKIAQLCVFAPYAAYVLFGLFFMVHIEKKWFLRRKIRQWARLLDADQDGVISQEDMRITNEKLERLRRMIGARQTALSLEDQQKWWNDNNFKCGPGKNISVEDYMAHLLEKLGLSKSPEMASKVRPVIKGWFKFFTTEDYMKRNLIIGEYDFIRFWSILAEYVPESHCKKMFIKNFPTPFTMDSFLEDFVSFVSNPDFYDEYSNRVYNVIKPRPSGMCEQV
uniref:Uncharacterized protein LOC111102917 n=1 Tax=Crassostrea virginica TaxID=6565 RepID=A0A8B8AK51_CRAVI|nr:uncharacterized protein LOC111102917 [Crassostrea virginica]